MRGFVLPLLLLSLAAHAQVCSGSLGDPILNITFGSGADVYGPPLPPGVTNLKYALTNCPEGGDVGSYAIVHGPGFNCFTGDWVNFAQDHSPDAVGYCMLINAQNAPSDFYKQTVGGLCPSTSYQFGAWVVNMASHDGEIKPNITFSIERTDGTPIQSFETGDIPVKIPLDWTQYAFYFATPPGVSEVVIRMTNNAPGGYGNDLALDDITFRTAGPSVDIHIDGRSGDSALLCSGAGNTLLFTSAVSGCFMATSYQWQESVDGGGSWNDIAGATGADYTAHPVSEGSALYRLEVAETGNIFNAACRTASGTNSVVVLKTAHPAISIGLEPDHVCADSMANFVAAAVDGGGQPHYQWMVNGGPAGGDEPVFVSGGLVDGDVVSCMLSSDAVCVVSPSAVSNNVTVHPLPSVVSSVEITASANNICQDSVVVFQAVHVNGGGDPSFTWMVNGASVGKDGVEFSTGGLNNGDVVSVVMKSDLLCSAPVASNAVPMTVYDVPRVRLTPDTIIAAGGYAVLHPVITGDYVSYSWSPDVTPDGVVSPHTTTTYQLLVTNGNACVARAFEKVEVFYDLPMPNAFTPNGDGHNDIFRVPAALAPAIRRFSIYNRVGMIVFATKNGAEGWDGTVRSHVQSSGTYVWVIEYYHPILRRMVVKKGTLELIR